MALFTVGPVRIRFKCAAIFRCRRGGPLSLQNKETRLLWLMTSEHSDSE